MLQDVLDLWNELGISPTTSKDPKLQRISEEPASESPASTLDLAILHTIQWTTRTGDTTATVAVSAPPNLLKADASTLHRLSDRKAALEKEREGRMQRIQDLYDQLYPLWTRLGVSDEEADEFVETWKGCEQRCIEAVGLLSLRGEALKTVLMHSSSATVCYTSTKWSCPVCFE